MKHTEQKMNPIKAGNPDVEVKMKPTGVGMKPIEQFMIDGFHFYCDKDSGKKDSIPRPLGHSVIRTYSVDK